LEIVMRHAVLIIAGLIATIALPGHAFAQRGYYAFGAMQPAAHENEAVAADHYVGPATLPPARRFTRGEVRQIAAWGAVGRCVVAKDRNASLAYVQTSGAANVATPLEPAFGACFAGTTLPSKGNKAMRRAALADALGIKTAK
jgi:hypothetical protein